MEVFFTATRGVGGRLKRYAEDFVVEEISNPPRQWKGQICRRQGHGHELGDEPPGAADLPRFGHKPQPGAFRWHQGQDGP